MITGADARRLLKTVADDLSAEGQLGPMQNPVPALEMLVDQHVLLQEPTRSIRFQHELFADWYAYHELVEAEPFFPDEPAARAKFLRRLNNAAWEEAILFACEAVSVRGDDERQVVCRLILAALSVSPLLAARIIRRSHHAIWSSVKPFVVVWLKRWLATHYRAGLRLYPPPRPLRFMLTARKPDLDELAKSHLAPFQAFRDLLAQTDRLDLLPQISLRPRIRPIFANVPANRKERATDVMSKPQSAVGLHFESACELGSDFWRLPDLDLTPAPRDGLASRRALSDGEKDEMLEIATYFSDVDVLVLLVARVLKIRRRAKRLNLPRPRFDQRADAIRRIVRRISCCHADGLMKLLEAHCFATDLETIDILCDVVAGRRRSASVNTGVFGVSVDRRGRLAEILSVWIDLAIADPAFEYRHACQLAIASARIQNAQLAAPLQRLLRHCLDRFPQSVAAESANRWKRADRWSFTIAPAPILEALMANDDGSVMGFLAELSSSDEIIVDCAYALARMVHPAFDYEIELKSMPPRRQTEGPQATPAIDCEISARFAAACARLLDRADFIDAGRAGKCLASIPGILNPSEIERLLSSIDLRPRVGVLKALAWGGSTFDGTSAAAWVKAYFELFGNVMTVTDTVCLLIFSDRPLECVDYYELIAAQSPPRAYGKSSLFLDILDKSPSDVATEVLFAVVERSAGFSKNRRWIASVTAVASPRVARKLVDMSRSALHQEMVLELSLDESVRKRLAAADPDLFDYIARTGRSHKGPIPYATPFLLLKGRLSWKQIAIVATAYADMGQEMDDALRELIVAAFRLHGDLPIIDAAALQNARTTMFKHAPEISGARVLHAALTLIDDCCDENGGYDLLPRHPELASGLPWPTF